MRRSGVAARRLVQLDLFGAPEGRQAPARPVSDVTGGPLNAVEATRAYMGKSLRCVGWVWESGRVACRPCRSKMLVELKGEGYVQPLFEEPPISDWPPIRRCFDCGAEVRGIEGS